MANTNWGGLGWSAGNFGGLNDVTVQVTAPGTPTTWGSNSWGQFGWGENVGLSTLQGNVTVGIINVAALVFGQQLTTSLNNVAVDLNTPVNLTTNLATLSLNSVATKLDVAVNVTGFRLTGTTAQIYVSAWAPVNTGQSVNWTEVAA